MKYNKKLFAVFILILRLVQKLHFQLETVFTAMKQYARNFITTTHLWEVDELRWSDNNITYLHTPNGIFS